MQKTLSGTDLEKQIFNVNAGNFEKLALEIFRFQYQSNQMYRKYCDAIRAGDEDIKSISHIPFLPVQFFKTQQIVSGTFEAEIIFESSGTTGSVKSKHFVKDLSLYRESFLKCFTHFYGPVENLCIIALLPSYREKNNASLVFMVDELIRRSRHADSGFYPDEYQKLQHVLLRMEENKQPALLIGVTYALLDFAEKFPIRLQFTKVMETGGMKGRRKELQRNEVHDILKQQLGINEVHSEYGMTELLSQAYSKQSGIFNCPPWMQVLLRSEDDPFEVLTEKNGKDEFVRGAVNIIDLANLYSCAFIATDDAGKLYPDGSFEITGRLENSDIRGCGLLMM